MSRILLGESQEDLASALRESFISEHFVVELESNGLRILECLRHNHYEVIILEIALAGLDGISIVRDYRATGGNTPILLLAGSHSSQELQTGLDAGADGYMVKPFELKDLHALIRAMMRRPTLHNMKLLKLGNVEMDTVAGVVTKDGIPVHLYPMEFKLLQFLLKHPNQVFDTHAIFERVWQKDQSQTEDTVRTHVRTLRKKIDSEGNASIITTVRGQGYKTENS